MDIENEQELMVEMKLKVVIPKMTIVELVEEIKKIIINQWESSKYIVELKEIQMVSISDADLAFHKNE